MKVFKATLSIDMSITTFIIGTLCQDRKGEDTGYDHQHLKDNLQKHDDNSPGCYQKSDEINNGKDGDYQALACARSTLLSESRHRLAIICYKSIKNPRDGKVANPQKTDREKSNNIHENPCNILRISAKTDKNILRISAKVVSLHA